MINSPLKNGPRYGAGRTKQSSTPGSPCFWRAGLHSGRAFQSPARHTLLLVSAGVMALLCAFPRAHAASGTWTNTTSGSVGYWTTSANWSGASYPGTANGESAGINSATPNTYTCILDTVARYFPDYVDVTIGNTGGGMAWLIVTNGGAFASYHGNIGTGGRIVVTGTGSRAGKFQALNMGGQGAMLRIENGAAFLGQNSTFGVHVGGHEYGGNPGTNCAIVVTGKGSTFTNNMGAQQTQVGSGSGSLSNRVEVLDGAVMVTTITMGSQFSSLTVSGTGSAFEGDVSMGGSNTFVYLSAGGQLTANTLNTSGNASYVFTNAGGIYQFTTATPTITTNGNVEGSILLNSGTIAFRGVSSGLNLTNNTDPARLGRMTWMGNNTLRLNSSSAVNTTPGGYRFDTGSGPANYCRLEMINGTNALTGNGITIGTNGSFMVSDTAARITGSVTNLGTIAVLSGRLSCSNGLTLGSNSTIVVGLLANTNGSLNIAGTFTHAGSLVVTNLSGFAWADGQTWDLFDWSGTPLNFSSIQLPSPGTKFVWDTKLLKSEGILSIKPFMGTLLIVR